MYNYNNKNSLTVEIKMVFTQPPPHQQKQQRDQHEAQIPEKWKTLLRQNLHLLRKIAEVHSNTDPFGKGVLLEGKFE